MTTASNAPDAAGVDATSALDAAGADEDGSLTIQEDAEPPTADDAGTSPDGGQGPVDASEAGSQSASEDAGDSQGSGERLAVVAAAGANHQLALSIDDGRTWCLTNEDDSMSGHDNPHLLRNITYANGYFVSGSWRALFRSRNGYAWEDVLETAGDDQPVIGQWVAQVQYGNGYWVATGGYGTVMRSTDMVSWENLSDQLPGGQASRTLAFGDGVFVTGRDGAGWWESSDGTDWTQRDPGGSSRLYFDGTQFRDHPGYDCGPDGQTCLRGGDSIERSEDGGNSWVTVATFANVTSRFAFGEAPAADFAEEASLPSSVRGCLGL